MLCKQVHKIHTHTSQVQGPGAGDLQAMLCGLSKKLDEWAVDTQRLENVRLEQMLQELPAAQTNAVYRDAELD